MKEVSNAWPALPFAEWQDTASTLHMWTQIVGKIRLALTPWTNHSWHVTFYVTSRGLTTSPIPHGVRMFEINFDFIDHQVRIDTSDGERRTIELKPRSVADFYRAVMKTLDELHLPVTINKMPNEIQDPIPFDEDEEHRFYDREYANRFWRVLVQTDRVFKEFRSRFCGKCSPVHFFWGSFDLAVTRFSGRPAPPHPGGIPHLPDAITHALFRAAGATASRRDPAPARCNHARGVLAGGQQPRFLARQRRRADADFLFLRLSRTTGVFRSEGPAGGSLLRIEIAGVHVAI